jgi:peptide subunit release factor 1 (eRF1)
MIAAETINRIIQFHGDGLPVVSLYVPVGLGGNQREVHSRVTSLVDRIDPLAKDRSAEHERRMSLCADIERIKERLGEERWQPGAIAIFSCSGRGLYEEISLPRRVRDWIVVDETAFARPMLAVLDEYHRSCVVVIDKASAQVWELYLDEMRELTRVRDRALRKRDYAAGLAEDRVRNKADELSKRHYRRVVEMLDELFRAGEYDLLIIGGHDYEVPAFLDFLTHDLRGRVAGSFSIDPATAPLAEVRANADSIVQRYERAEEQRLVAEVLEKFAAGGLATVGLDTCLWAGSVAAIQKLLVQEGAIVPGVVCDQSGWLALEGDACPLCGNPTRRAPDVIDELVAAVTDEGGSINHVKADTELKDCTLAATLRFPLAPSADLHVQGMRSASARARLR